MNERKIVVPDGLLKAGAKEIDCGGSMPANAAVLAGQVLQGALKWLGENPICPTQEQKDHLLKHFSPIGVERWDKGMWFNFIADCAVEWQRRMFIAPDPDEEIKDLLFSANLADSSTIEIANNKLRDAYRRGLKKRKVGE